MTCYAVQQASTTSSGGGEGDQQAIEATQIAHEVVVVRIAGPQDESIAISQAGFRAASGGTTQV